MKSQSFIQSNDMIEFFPSRKVYSSKDINGLLHVDVSLQTKEKSRFFSLESHTVVLKTDEINNKNKDWEDGITILNSYDQIESSLTRYKDRVDFKRQIEYSDIGDQLDSIIKTLKHLKTVGVDIGVDADSLILMSDSVKAKYPKV